MNKRLTVILAVAITAVAWGMIHHYTANEALAQSKGKTATKATPAPAKQLPRIIDLGAKSCIPCKMMAPILVELKKEYAGVLEVEFIDVWEKPALGRQYRVTGIPTQIFYDTSGKEVGRHLGYMSKEDILGAFKQLGMPIKKKVQ